MRQIVHCKTLYQLTIWFDIIFGVVRADYFTLCQNLTIWILSEVLVSSTWRTLWILLCPKKKQRPKSYLTLGDAESKDLRNRCEILSSELPVVVAMRRCHHRSNSVLTDLILLYWPTWFSDKKKLLTSPERLRLSAFPHVRKAENQVSTINIIFYWQIIIYDQISRLWMINRRCEFSHIDNVFIMRRLLPL